MKTAEELIAFEKRVESWWEAGELPFLTHLSGGNEKKLIEIFSEVKDSDWVFSTHRSHYHALLKGITELELENLIKGGRSMFVFNSKLNFFTSSVLSGTCAIAAGVAWHLSKISSGSSVFCFVGDGAIENGHCYEAALFVDAHNLPCRFIIESNGRQVDTPVEERRGSSSHLSNPLSNFKCVTQYEYTPTYCHAGNGTKKTIKFKDIKP